MSHHTKLDEKIKGFDNELDSYINEEVPVLEGDEPKALCQKTLVMAKRIIADSIKDHLIP